MSNQAYDVLRAQILLQQCAIDALLQTHPDCEKVADLFLNERSAFLKLIAEKAIDPEAVEVTKLMRRSMLERLGRAEH